MSSDETGSKLKCIVRPMRHGDIDKCLSIWSQVQLTEARQTAASFLSADPDGFYVSELEETGEVIGMCSGTLNRPDTAFMGFYAVLPEYQGYGVGRSLWSRTLGRLEKAAINVGLYGVPSMSEKYRKSGFVLEDSVRMLIFESERGANHKSGIGKLKDIEDLTGCRLETIDGSTSEAIFKKLVDYDHAVQRCYRDKLLRLYLRGDDVPLTVAVLKDQPCLRAARPCSLLTCEQHHSGSESRKSSCCAKTTCPESIFEDEALSTTADRSLSISSGELPLKTHPPIDIPSVVDSTHIHPATGGDCVGEIVGYGCIRMDNNSGGMIGPIYADSSEICEVIMRNLMSRFELKEGNIFSVMALDSNKQACKILKTLGLVEIDQCSRMFTKFIPSATLSKVYYIHSPNFTLF